MSFKAVGNEEVSILKSEVDELENFLSNLIEKQCGSNNKKIIKSSSQSSLFTAQKPDNEYMDDISEIKNLSSSIAYTTVDDGDDPNILDVIAFEEVKSSDSSVKAKNIGVQWDINDINYSSSDEFSSLNTCLNTPPTAISNQLNSNLLTKSDIVGCPKSGRP